MSRRSYLCYRGLSIIQEEKEEFSLRKTFDLNLNVMNNDYQLLRAV